MNENSADGAEDQDPQYRRSAEVVYRELQDYAEFARRLQSEYGKWLITTLWLVHAGAIAGLIFKNSSPNAPPYLPAIWAFVAGLVLALATGFCAWINFSLIEASLRKMADHRMLRWRKYWPSPTVPYKCAINGSLTLAVVFGILSVACVPIGAVLVACLWHK